MLATYVENIVQHCSIEVCLEVGDVGRDGIGDEREEEVVEEIVGFVGVGDVEPDDSLDELAVLKEDLGGGGDVAGCLCDWQGLGQDELLLLPAKLHISAGRFGLIGRYYIGLEEFGKCFFGIVFCWGEGLQGQIFLSKLRQGD